VDTELPHRVAQLTVTRKNFHWIRTISGVTLPRMDPGAHRLGSVMIAASAVTFGALAVFGKLAFDAGVGIVTLLFVRFAVSAAVLWAATLRTRGALAATGMRAAVAGLALGAVGYALQAG